eukprot:3514141-Rhodomonas_salina.1
MALPAGILPWSRHSSTWSRNASTRSRHSSMVTSRRHSRSRHSKEHTAVTSHRPGARRKKRGPPQACPGSPCSTCEADL